MKTLCLNVEKGRRIYGHSGFVLYVFSKAYLVAVLDLLELLKNAFIGIVFEEIRKLFGLFAVIRADALVKKSGKLGVRVAEPSSVGNTVCNVCELVGILFAEVTENVVYEYIGMKL